MSGDYRDAMVSWYRNRARAGASNLERLSSGTEDRRKTRFHVLQGVGIQDGDSVLDVGCGLGDFLAHLRAEGINIDYTGYDFVPEFIDEAKKAYPKARFEVRDILADPPDPKSFDVVVASQVVNLRLEGVDSDRLADQLLEAMFAAARKGVAMDFVTSYVDFQQEYLHYHRPEARLRTAKNLTKRVVLRHDYPLFEFCLYLYPDFRGWGGEASE